MTNNNVVPFSGTELKKQLDAVLPDELQQDLEKAREDIREIAAIGMQAVADAAGVATQSQNDRMYAALSSLIKASVDANRELIATHQAERELKQSEVGPTHVTNQLVVTTNELLDKILEKDNENV